MAKGFKQFLKDEGSRYQRLANLLGKREVMLYGSDGWIILLVENKKALEELEKRIQGIYGLEAVYEYVTWQDHTQNISRETYLKFEKDLAAAITKLCKKQPVTLQQIKKLEWDDDLEIKFPNSYVRIYEP